MIKKAPIVCAIFLLSLLLYEQASGQTGLWQTIEDGIEYREFYTPDPNRIFVTRMDRSNPDLLLETGISQGKISGDLEPVSGMFKRYDQTLHFANGSWGERIRVVSAINGYFYDTETGIPTRGQVSSGWYVKRFDDFENGSGLSWKENGEIFFGGCVVHRGAKQTITHFPTGKTFSIKGINIPREDNSIIVYTSHYGATTKTDDEGIEVVVELSAPLGIVPNGDKVTGRVLQVRDQTGSTPILFDQAIISASGEFHSLIRSFLKEGDEVGFSQEIKHFEPDCKTPNQNDWMYSRAALGSSFIFLEGGELSGFDDLGAILKTARTAVAYDDDYIYFIVVDDSEQFGNTGMSIVDLALFVKQNLDAKWAAALDGGGSSTMVVEGNVKNHLALTGENAETSDIERAVANSLMMVVRQPREQSNRYSPGEELIITGDGEQNIFAGPGENYSILESAIPGLPVFVSPDQTGLNGILASGSFWWKISFPGGSGWVRENSLSPG
jgi:hypothetical protein